MNRLAVVVIACSSFWIPRISPPHSECGGAIPRESCQFAATCSRNEGLFAGLSCARELPLEHPEDQLPIPIGRGLVVNVTIRQRVAVVGSTVDFMRKSHLAATQGVLDRIDGRRRREAILLSEATVDFPISVLRRQMR